MEATASELIQEIAQRMDEQFRLLCEVSAKVNQLIGATDAHITEMKYEREQAAAEAAAWPAIRAQKLAKIRSM